MKACDGIDMVKYFRYLLGIFAVRVCYPSFAYTLNVINQARKWVLSIFCEKSFLYRLITTSRFCRRNRVRGL